MQELAVLLLSPVGLPLGLEELEHEGAAGADFVAAGQEVAADEGFEDAGFAAALAADDGDLGELDGGLAPQLGEDVLELVDYGDHGVAERRRRRQRGGRRCRFFRHRRRCERERTRRGQIGGPRVWGTVLVREG